MNLQDLISSATDAITELVQGLAPSIPPDTVRLAGGALLGALALILLLFALKLLLPRKKGRPAKRVNVPRTLQQEGMSVDVLTDPKGNRVAARCVVTTVASSKIKCEIIERLEEIRAREGDTVACVFAPVKTSLGAVNSFTAKLLKADGPDRDRLILSVPTGYAQISRRKHARKRVADQQFIRIKLWVEEAYTSDIAFPDAAPHVAVNSFATEDAAQSANAVLNISHGGLGLSIRNEVIPENCAPGSQVTINLFMFSFREKTFKPYWYAGEIRSMHEGRPGFTRLGIEFNGSGKLLGETGSLRWDRF
ncbi:hypothetical protein GM415_12250 [Pseudodesulfovibrio cashew]|uniref:PilZ domain-containing protein n=1 Tax=Pseudodesulfovibrio cashew TaxID=2678688 RepID=A0A6I6JDG6_9BACT|nr:hypothetical protein [Pseudodesulfovibrio cashew]QGY40866.1 hypothetical protein GM415_12250 [Pseudodesulfovibrio cashew]